MESKQPDTVQQELLSGWKDIAHYLGRGVRTVQRYERDLGLPVRRPVGHPSGAVVAMKSDLDSWVRSSSTAQESFNREQKSLNRVQKSLNAEQISFNNERRSAEDRLVAEIAKGLQDRTGLQTQVTELRKELRMSVSKVRENLSKLSQQLNEMRRRQDFMASVIKDHSKRRASLSGNGKRRKPN
jgi:septal ring factor EnvC (AmiA/AmiB activator)